MQSCISASAEIPARMLAAASGTRVARHITFRALRELHLFLAFFRTPRRSFNIASAITNSSSSSTLCFLRRFAMVLFLRSSYARKFLVPTPSPSTLITLPAALSRSAASLSRSCRPRQETSCGQWRALLAPAIALYRRMHFSRTLRLFSQLPPFPLSL
jgi:hypothetical protein